GDTLWKIALEVRPDRSVSVQQTMLALKAANPEAFINDNINLLKAGHVLRIPEANTIRSESLGSAVAEVRVQNEPFDAYKTGSVAQLDASRRQVQSDAGASTEDDGELKLLASSESSGDRAGSGSDAREQELQDDLAVAEEDLDRAHRANTELNVRFEDLQGQLDTLNEILTLKDDQLAALRAEVQKMQASAGPAPVVTPTPQSAASGSLLTNPLVLAGLGLLLVGGVAAGLILVRRRQQSSAVDDDLEEEVEEEGALQVALEEDAEAQIEVEDAAVAMDATIISTEPIEAIVDSDDLDLDAVEDDEISLDLEDDDELELDLGDDEDAISLDLDDDDDAISLALDDDDDAISLDLDDDDDAISLDLDDDDDAISLDLDDDDDAISLDLDDDDDAISLDLDDNDDAISLDLDDDDDELSLDLDDDDVISLDLEDDGGNKLDLARAYIDMGDGDGARSVLEEVIKKGSESEIQEANELLEKIK
ncbi:MAG TPA: FimV/HubP family polar landmark protein, partial [Gammaproteobacteria bacterium]|nr:FimV/HubP family polar landmark protein [Gammaproteobacteria bacterium]